MFRRAPSRVGRGCRAAVAFVVCFGWGGFFRVFSDFFFFERTRPAASMRPSCLIYLSTITGVRTGCHYLFVLSVCACVQHSSFLVIAKALCTRPISTNPGSMEAGEYGLAHGARFVAVCLEVVAVAGLMWVSWCVCGGAGFFRVLHEGAFSIS